MEIFSGVIKIEGITFLMFSSFICIFLGLALGRITIKGINLGAAGVFIISLLYGAIFSSHIKSTISQKSDSGEKVDISQNGLKIIENIGLILFIGSVGFLSGPNFFKNLKKNYKSYLLVGIFVILISTLTCVVIFYIAKSSEDNVKEFVSMLVGIFSGSLTSTPAFSAAKSTSDEEYEIAVTVGHGIAYLFGVIGVVLFVQLIPKILGADMEHERELILGKNYEIKNKETEKTLITTNIKVKNKKDNEELDSNRALKKKNIEKNNIIDLKNNQIKITDDEKNNKDELEEDEKNKEENIHKESEFNSIKQIKKINIEQEKKDDLFILDKYGLCVFSFTALVGIFIGAIRIPLSGDGLDGATFSFTTTGGVLIISLILGHYGKLYKLSLKIEKQILQNLRELGLILFLLGSGISGGTKFVKYFKAIYFIYGIIITIMPLILGFLFNKYIFKLELLDNLGALTGAMTSTPALGALISVSKTEQVGNPYAATYPIALICVVLSSQFMVLLLE